jgi:hypothetical protein
MNVNARNTRVIHISSCESKILTSLTSSLSLCRIQAQLLASSLLAKTIVITDLIVQSKSHYWHETSTLFIHVGDNVELLIWIIGAAGAKKKKTKLRKNLQVRTFCLKRIDKWRYHVHNMSMGSRWPLFKGSQVSEKLQDYLLVMVTYRLWIS